MLLGLSYNCYTFAKDSHNRVILNIFNLAETTSSIRLPISLPKFLDQSPKSVFKEVSKWILQEKWVLNPMDRRSLAQTIFGEAKWSLNQGSFRLRFVCPHPTTKKINGKITFYSKKAFSSDLLGHILDNSKCGFHVFRSRLLFYK